MHNMVNKEKAFEMIEHFKDLLAALGREDRNLPSIESELANTLISYKDNTDKFIADLTANPQYVAEVIRSTNNPQEEVIEWNNVISMCEILEIDLDEPIFSNFVKDIVKDLKRITDLTKNLSKN